VQVVQGKFITNCHTLRNANQISIIYPDGQMSATLARADYFHDVCLLDASVLNKNLPKLAPSEGLSVGQPVIAIGYGPSFSLSITSGTITALSRYDDAYVLRTSAQFPRGASGGGLFDEEGRLVGILTFSAPRSDELNYAVPVDWAGHLLGDSVADDVPPASQAFWEDSSPHQPAFLRATRMEFEGAWHELEALATDWVLAQGDEAEAWIALGRARMETAQRAASVAAFERAVSLQPHHREAWYWLALAYHALGMGVEFTDAASRLTQLDAALGSALQTAVGASLVEEASR
jgi:hypothetical protein